MSRYLTSSSVFAMAVGAAALVICPGAKGPSASGFSSIQANQFPETTSSQAEAELRLGIELTLRRLFSEAIPHFLAAKGHVVDQYAADFNLALCYVGIARFQKAIEILRQLRETNRANADVENLLAQAYVGNGQPNEAFEALERAANLTPTNEKLYLFSPMPAPARRLKVW